MRSLPPVTSYVGGEAVFQCEVLSNPPATVQWSFHISNASSQPLTGNARISINGATLAISDIQPSDEGFYECTALNIYGPNSTSGRLFIEGMVIWEQSVTPLHVYANSVEVYEKKNS